jgi:chaperonin GroES
VNLKPLGDRVVIKRIAEREQTDAGVYMPETAREKGLEFEVMAVGAGRIWSEGPTRSQIAAALSFLSFEEMGDGLEAIEKIGLSFGKRVPLSVNVGDVVLMGRYSGTDLKVDGVEYTIVHEDEIMAVVPRKAA